MPGQGALSVLEPIQRPSVADSVFEELHRQILRLELPPGTKLSEFDVARALGVSRQPVRDAFYRLSKLGFITIRPQRATVVSAISERAVMQARFIRMAIEVETARVACARLTEADLGAIERIIVHQEQAVARRDPAAFHDLDDQFHREICERSGTGFAWETAREMKSHMDRVRYLSLSFASERAFEEHKQILAAIRARDPDRAAEMVRQHLSRILDQIVRIRAENEAYFAEES
ncbi:MAG: GntR family transcriptional regulator [Tabrizicola sp.]|jgi:DNA-binding GntR family transcriptional regulator|nr:GntR family transcriptional regulator [Tabrizicola sp.]